MDVTQGVLHVENFAHLAPLTVELADLTVFVGPQATGKSLLLQLFKLILDQGAIARALKRYGFVWSGNFAANRLYFGEGFEHIWREDTSVVWEGEQRSILHYTNLPDRKEKVFYIPAQRALIFQQNSWPRSFDVFRNTDPFVVRNFSEQIRRFLEDMQSSLLFPRERRLHRTIRERLEDAMFRGASLEIVTEESVKRLMLTMPHGDRLPYLGWSAGQREFVPLLLGAYWLLPLGRNPRRALQWVIVEEPEMGLHPAAVESTLLLILELLNRGYKVILSTHSADVVGMVWALRFLQQCNTSFAVQGVRQLFDLKAHAHVEALATTVLSKTMQVYYFQPQKPLVQVRDISSLDAFDEDDAVAEWGGITEFATRANETVARCAAVLEGNDV